MARPARVVPLIAAAGALVVAGAVAWHLWSPRRTPPGQPPLARIAPSTLGLLRDAFNAASDVPRVVVLVSPT